MSLKFHDQRKKTLPRAECLELIRRAQAGDTAARNRVVESTLMLVSRQVGRWVQHFGCPELEDDMLQAAVAGNGRTSGLIAAVMKFDTESGYMWSTYAMCYINAEIRSVFTEACGRSIGRSASARVARLRAAATALESKLGRPPTVEELQADFIARGKPAPSLAQIELAVLGAVPHGAGYGSPDSAATGGEDAAVSALDEARDAAELAAAIERLPDEERAVIQGRLAGKTLHQLGREVGRSRERVRQRETAALERLRDELT